MARMAVGGGFIPHLGLVLYLGPLPYPAEGTKASASRPKPALSEDNRHQQQKARWLRSSIETSFCGGTATCRTNAHKLNHLTPCKNLQQNAPHCCL